MQPVSVSTDFGRALWVEHKRSAVLDVLKEVCMTLREVYSLFPQKVRLEIWDGPDTPEDVFCINQGACYSPRDSQLNLQIFSSRLLQNDDDMKAYMYGRAEKAVLYAHRVCEPGMGRTLGEMAVSNGFGMCIPVGRDFHPEWLPPCNDGHFQQLAQFFYQNAKTADTKVIGSFLFDGNCDNSRPPCFGGFAVVEALVGGWVAKQGEHVRDLIHTPAETIIAEMKDVPLVPFWSRKVERPAAPQWH